MKRLASSWRVRTEFDEYLDLARWLVEMRADILDNLDMFLPANLKDTAPNQLPLEQIYAVHLFVYHSDETSSSVILESNLSYEGLFGRIECRPAEGGLITDFSMVRVGSIHRRMAVC
jgi:predicted ATP-dependent protease